MLLKIKIANKTLTHTAATEIVTIGRSSDCEFVVENDDFSRKHCIITFKGSYVFITDLGSKNGVIVDGKRITPNQAVPIYPASKILLANLYQLMLPDATEIKSLSGLELQLEKIVPRRG